MKKCRDFDLSFNINKNFQRLRYLQNDVSNLVEFIRRARDERVWSIDGLQFYEINYEDLFGYKSECKPGM